LTAYLKQCQEPFWTSYFVKVSSEIQIQTENRSPVNNTNNLYCKFSLKMFKMINAVCHTSIGHSTRAQTIIYCALLAILLWNITAVSGKCRIFHLRINSFVSWR